MVVPRKHSTSKLKILFDPQLITCSREAWMVICRAGTRLRNTLRQVDIYKCRNLTRSTQIRPDRNIVRISSVIINGIIAPYRPKPRFTVEVLKLCQLILAWIASRPTWTLYIVAEPPPLRDFERYLTVVTNGTTRNKRFTISTFIMLIGERTAWVGLLHIGNKIGIHFCLVCAHTPVSEVGIVCLGARRSTSWQTCTIAISRRIKSNRRPILDRVRDNENGRTTPRIFYA